MFLRSECEKESFQVYIATEYKSFLIDIVIEDDAFRKISFQGKKKKTTV